MTSRRFAHRRAPLCRKRAAQELPLACEAQPLGHRVSVAELNAGRWERELAIAACRSTALPCGAIETAPSQFRRVHPANFQHAADDRGESGGL